MLIQRRELSAGSLLRADVCIVGAGAAGLALAWALDGEPLDVLLLEAGEQGINPGLQDGADGTAETAILPGRGDYPFRESRVRALGGTTLRWSGACLALDADDFQARPWLRGSGWPIDRAELDPFYCQAARFLGLPAWERHTQLDSSPLQGRGLVATPVLHPPTLDQARRHRHQIKRSANVRLLMRATVLELLREPESQTITALRVGDRQHPEIRVEARWVVLAAGGLENCRLLLASRSTDAAGLGNGYDQVGRCFMEHGHRAVALLELGPFWRWLRPFTDLTPIAHSGVPPARQQATLGLAGTLRDTHALLNLHLRACRYHPLEAAGAVVAAKAAWRERDAASLATRAAEPRHWPLLASYLLWHSRQKLLPRTRFGWVRLMGWLEQEPDPQNRVTLSRHRDALGQPLAHLHLRFSNRMNESVERSLQLIASRLAARGCGSLVFDPQALLHLGGTAKVGCHHMGGTRMHNDPRHGVVDGDGRVHELTNLFVAGSSVFPTGGAANPTFTLVALSLRLADHLGRLARKAAR
ncbi:MAG: GMC family oxidoreductase [Cyanobacteriota bacterium]|nr:GMC family oxidoreductase [Cyanobacteriota bacterium]